MVLEGKQIRAYFKKQVFKFEKNFYKSISSYDEAAIHDLRVSIKRIRALFRFLNEYQLLRPCSKRYLTKIKKIYAPLGVLRDLQIKTGLVSEYHIDDLEGYHFFCKWLESQQYRGKIKLKNVFRQFSFREFYQFKHRLPYVRKGTVELDHDQILKKRLTRINKLISAEDIRPHLHDIRKKLKEIYYFLEMCKLEQSECRGITLNLQSIRQLEDDIGRWHDNVLLLHELQLNGSVIHPEGILSNSNLRSKIIATIDRLYPRIRSELRHYRLADRNPKTFLEEPG
jgi:CHAD domain-containing protein